MKLVLVRHGESVWNLENKFTGWTDVDLSENGVKEAHDAGNKLKEANIHFDIYYTSVLVRAVHTLEIIESILKLNVPIIKNWRLNERHYGALQGLNKSETAEKYGDEQVKLWRRSYDVCPPKLTKDDERYPGNDLKYKDLSTEELPLSESLEDTCKRTVPYYEEVIKKSLKKGENVLVVAHGNSLRSIRKHIDNISDDDIAGLEIPTGKPFVYEFDDDMNIIDSYYL